MIRSIAGLDKDCHGIVDANMHVIQGERAFFSSDNPRMWPLLLGLLAEHDTRSLTNLRCCSVSICSWLQLGTVDWYNLESWP
jgi:hypothetical protein